MFEILVRNHTLWKSLWFGSPCKCTSKEKWGLPKEPVRGFAKDNSNLFLYVPPNPMLLTMKMKWHVALKILITFHSYFCNKDVRKQLRKMNGNATEKNRKDCLKKIWESSSSIPNPFSKALFLKDIVRWGFSFNPFNYLLPITKGMKTRVVDSHYSMVINCQRKTRHSLWKVWRRCGTLF